MKRPLSTLLLVLLAVSAARATDLYVSLAGGHVFPFTNWANAAINIQAAVDAASAGDTVWVTNGVYASGGRPLEFGLTTNRVLLTNAVALRSVNGPELTVIQGYQMPGVTNGPAAVRCVYMAGEAFLSGFTLTNGATGGDDGGGVYGSGGQQWGPPAVSNCVLIGNAASYDGGGAAYVGLDHCTLATNSAFSGGGSAYCALTHCTLIGNIVHDNAGGGAFDCLLSNCTLVANSAPYGGGSLGGALVRCLLANNSAETDGGGAQFGSLRNCVLTGNLARHNGGGACGWDNLPSCRLYDCTVVGNVAYGAGGGAYSATLKNCIVGYNSAWEEPNYSASALDYCCTTPLPTTGNGNITSPPLFVDYVGGDLRLMSNSPCINAGLNANASATPDLDGSPRIAGGTVDMGAYEFQTPTSTLSYTWAQQYGIPTDGSADSADPDHDGMSNWQEWRCQTDPTNALSVLRLVSSAPAAANVVVTWQSIAGVTYALEYATNLSSSAFASLATNLMGQAGTTAFIHTNGASKKSGFYRVQAE